MTDALLPSQTQAFIDARVPGHPHPSYRTWMVDVTRKVNAIPGDASDDITAIATALGSPDGTVTNIPDQSADDVSLVEGYGISLTGTGAPNNPWIVGLRPLADSGTGTFKLLTRDSYGRAVGTEDGTAADVPYVNTTSGLTADDVQEAIDELAADLAALDAADISIADAGGYFTGTDVEAALQELGAGGGGGYPEGAANPGSPSTNDKFYRNDLNLLIYYDGTRWLTVQEYDLGGGVATNIFPFTANGYMHTFPVPSDYGIYLTRFVATTLVGSTNNGAAYWTIDLRRATATNTETSVASFNTSADTVSNWVPHDVAINAVLDASARILRIFGTKTGGPGGIYPPVSLRYRKIIT